ncbi:hypothetical protein [Tolumonas auensis]|uniref:hypothetical protein n=1 Tax=Tolumonas auensis TaxID=43948 RepID=UPI002AA90B68|nr:hypothetical protein [Tolumonas auensis]
MNNRKNMFALLVAGTLLTACGGGGTDISGGSSGSSDSTSSTTTSSSSTSTTSSASTTTTTSGGSSTSDTSTTATAGAATSIVADTLTTKFIALKGYNSVTTETAPVTFTVYDANGVAVPDQLVDFSFAINSSSDAANFGYSLSSLQATTNSSGKVTINVHSGTVPRVISVTAKLHSNSSISGSSATIATGTGLPGSSDGISNGMSAIGQEKSAINANVIGASSTFNIRLTDRFGANVPDGTVVRFSSTHGSVQGNLSGGTTSQFCEVTNGACEGTLISNGDYVGPVYVLAYTLGEEGFKDTNGDGILQESEAFDTSGTSLFNASSEPLQSPLVDVNNPAYVDYNGDNVWQSPDDVYQGRACVQSLIDAGHCKDQTIPVWQYTKFMFSGMGSGLSVAQLEVWDGAKWINANSPVNVSTNQFFRVIFASYSQDDGSLMPIPSDSEITVTSTNGGALVYQAKPTGYNSYNASQESAFAITHQTDIDFTKNPLATDTYPSVLSQPFYYYFEIPQEASITASTGLLTITAENTVDSTTSSISASPVTLIDSAPVQ